MSVLNVAAAVHRWGWLVASVGLVLVVVGLGRIFWPGKRVGRQLPSSDEELLDTAYAAGVVKVGGDE